MPSARDLHELAMEFADLGFSRRRQRQGDQSLAYFRQALDCELAAIAQIGKSDKLVWSILHRSAGTLALDCREFRQAEQITASALAGDPHPDIVEELRDLLEQIYFQRHLDLKGIELRDDELQLSLSGHHVGSGLVKYDEIYNRVDNTAKLLFRTAERKSGRDFREGGQPSKEIRDNYQTMVSVPRSGSFALTLRFGNLMQRPLPGMFDTAAIMDEFLELMGLMNQSRTDEIQHFIPDPAYFRNFFGLAKKLAPDGERVGQVGFTAIRGGEERSIQLTTPATEITLPPMLDEPETSGDIETIRGTLRYADGTRGTGDQIRLVDSDSGKIHRVRVPAGMMNDIIRPMWDYEVTITGKRSGNVLELQDILAIDQD